MSDLLNDEGYVLVVGSSGLDMVCRSRDELRYGTSNPGKLRISPGGVARNVAENIARLGMQVSLITAVGDDPQGRCRGWRNIRSNTRRHKWLTQALMQ